MDLRKTSRAVFLILLLGLSVAACSYSLAGGVAGFVVTGVVAALFLLGTSTTASGCGPCLSPVVDFETVEEEPDIGPCLTRIPDDIVDDSAETDQTDVGEPDIGPCLSRIPDDVDGPDAVETDVDEPDIGPCLDRVPDDIEADDVDEPDVGPCLEPEPPDADEKDADEPEIGPCLAPPLDIVEPPDADDSDADDAADGETKDAPAGPCLSLPPPDAESSMAPEPPQEPTPALARAAARSEIRERLAKHGVLPPDVAKRLGVDVDTSPDDSESA